MVSRIRLEDRECPLSTTVAHVGEWWTLLILHDAFDGYTRFDQFQANLGISSSMLTARLKALVADGLLERRPYQTKPTRHEYVLTDLGRSLRPVIVTLAAWGNARLAPKARSMILVDTQTGEEVEPIVVDATTGRRLDDSIAFAYAAGPAASDAMCARCPNTTRAAPDPRRHDDGEPSYSTAIPPRPSSVGGAVALSHLQDHWQQNVS
jgi:DNA-binding HxlR family transcriptional regulator